MLAIRKIGKDVLPNAIVLPYGQKFCEKDSLANSVAAE
jgi:hypothetical protein